MTARHLEREATAVALRAGGATLQEIGDVLGVSRERVRQLLSRAGHPAGALTAVDPLAILAAARHPDTTNWRGLARRLGRSGRNAERRRHARVLRALGVLPAVERLWRIRRGRPLRARRAHLTAQLATLAARLGRTPTTVELAAHCWPDRPVAANNAVPFLVAAWTSYRRGTTRGALRALYRSAGLTPRAVGGAGHVRDPTPRV